MYTMKSHVLFYISCMLCAFSIGSFASIFFFHSRLVSTFRHATDTNAHSYNEATEHQKISKDIQKKTEHLK